MVLAGPAQGPTITYTPAPGGTVTFPPAVAVGSTTTAQITLTSSGGANGGTTTVGSCTSTNPNIVFTDGTDTCTAGGTCMDGSLDLECTATNATQTGTVSCTQIQQNETNPGDGNTVTTTVSWNVTCPAANVPPILSYSPAPGNNVNSNQVGQGQTATGTIVVTPMGGSGNGTSTISNCTITGAVGATFTPPSGTLTFTGSTTTPQNLQFTCIAPNAGSGNGTATLTCDQTIGFSVTTVSWPITCLEGLPVAAPGVTYTPPGGTTITFPAGSSIGASVPGSTTIAVDINGGASGGGPQPETTTVDCTAPAGFTVSGVPIGPVSAPASVGTDGTVTVTCTSAATPQAGVLTCTASQSIDGGAPTTTITQFPLDCPAALVNITSNPPEGPITQTGAPNSNVSGSITLTNTGSASTLECTATAVPPGTISLTVPPTVPAGGSATISYTCSTGGVGVANYYTIVCQTQDPDQEAVLEYQLACVGQVDIPVPALNNLGKLMMVVLVIGIGLVGLGLRRV